MEDLACFVYLLGTNFLDYVNKTLIIFIYTYLLFRALSSDFNLASDFGCRVIFDAFEQTFIPDCFLLLQ